MFHYLLGLKAPVLQKTKVSSTAVAPIPSIPSYGGLGTMLTCLLVYTGVGHQHSQEVIIT